jgi:hypothetical protein
MSHKAMWKLYKFTLLIVATGCFGCSTSMQSNLKSSYETPFDALDISYQKGFGSYPVFFYLQPSDLNLVETTSFGKHLACRVSLKTKIDTEGWISGEDCLTLTYINIK